MYKKASNIEKSAEKIERHLKKIAKENKAIVKPAFKEFKKKASKLRGDFVELVRTQAVEALGCDE